MSDATGKITPLRGTALPDPGAADPSIIELATDIYLRAKRGEFACLAIAAVHADGVTTTDAFKGARSGHTAALAGAIADLQFTVANFRRDMDIDLEPIKPGPDDTLPDNGD